MRNTMGALVSLIALASGAAFAKDRCPDAVAKVARDQNAKILSCKRESAHGQTQYELKVESASAKRLEIDVSPDGKTLQTEQVVSIDSVPGAVRTAFDAKYPGLSPTRAEKQEKADGTVTFELAFRQGGKAHEATFGQDGRFIEQE